MNPVKKFTFSLNENDHSHIIEWCNEQKNLSQAIRDLIEADLGTETQQPQAHLDLGQIRAVVEAALDQKLAGLVVNNTNGHQPENAEANDALSAFDNLLA